MITKLIVIMKMSKYNCFVCGESFEMKRKENGIMFLYDVSRVCMNF